MSSAGPAAELAHEKTESGTLLLEIGRVFDVPEAWLVRDAITRAPPDLKLTLDFHRTAELHDFALAVLIELLSRESRRVEIHGLNAHQQSLLRLLGRPLSGGTTVVGQAR